MPLRGRGKNIPSLVLLGMVSLALGQTETKLPTKVEAQAEDSISSDTVALEKQAEEKDSVIAEAKDTATVPERTWLYGFKSKVHALPCREDAETLTGCLRTQSSLWPIETGPPGARSYWRDPLNYATVGYQSMTRVTEEPGALFSTYGLGGVSLPDAIEPTAPGMGLWRESWTPMAPLDTPQTRLRWQRGALTLNQFQVDLRRSLIGRAYLGFTYASSSADSMYYDYSFNVHQPYLSGWGFLKYIYAPIDCDSASLVLEGVQGRLAANQMKTRLGIWADSMTVFEFFWDRARHRSNLALPRHAATRDSVQALYPARDAHDGIGLIFAQEMGEQRAWRHEWKWLHHSKEAEWMAGRDSASVRVPRETLSIVSDRISGRISWRPQGAGQDSTEWALGTWAENRLMEGRLYLQGGEAGSIEKGWGDAQRVFLEGRYHLPFLFARFETGLTRQSEIDNQVMYLPGAGAMTTLWGPWQTWATIELSHRQELLDWNHRFRVQPTQGFFASNDLKPREATRAEARFGTGWKRLKLWTGWAGLHEGNAFASLLPPDTLLCSDISQGDFKGVMPSACASDSVTIPDSLALKYRNVDERSLAQILLGLQWGLGNWNLSLENRWQIMNVLDDESYTVQRRDATVPKRLFRGELFWKRRLISERLGVQVGWNWEWTSTRWTYASNLNGTSRLMRLDEYLVLDFRAAMQIKTFTLHFRAANMNHDRYAPEAGVHPTGVNFRFGIDWALLD